VLAVSWLAGKAGLPNTCCHENLQNLFEILQVKKSQGLSTICHLGPAPAELLEAFFF
jgi:hypothetical protein